MYIEHTDENTVEFLDDAGMSFMLLTTHRLNQVLQENGIENPIIRQEICGSFMFDFAYNLDAGWLIENDKKLFPKICFAERVKANDDENLGSLETLHIPTEASSWHEYAHGVVSQYFEDNEEHQPDIRTGSYDNEDQ